MIKFNMEIDGFCGSLFLPEKAFSKTKALIFVGNLEEEYLSAKIMAELFSKNGVNSLALAYFGEKGTVGEPAHIPLEYVEKALDKLNRMGFSKVGIWGFAEGAVYALTAASFFNLSCVIAVSPSHHVLPAYSRAGSVFKQRFMSGSFLSLGGKDLACLSAPKINRIKLLFQMIFTKKEETADIFREEMIKASADSIIPVEKIHGNVLIMSSDEDRIWPSKFSGEQIMDRLSSNYFKYKKEHIIYHFSSHYLLPFNLAGVRLKHRLKYFKIERKYSKQCNRTRIDAFNKTLDWLKKW